MSFRLKLIVTIAVLLALSFGVGGSLLIITAFQASSDEQTAAALDSYEMIRNTLYLLNSMGSQTDYASFSEVLGQIERQGSADWMALMLTGTDETIFVSGDRSLLSQDMKAPEVDQCAYTVCSGSQGHYLRVIGAIETENEVLTLAACFDISAAYVTRRSQERIFLVIYVCVVLIGVTVASVVSFSLTANLRRLTVTANKISNGDLTKRSAIRTKDEFGQLSAAFDTMTDKLEGNIRELEDSVRRQEAFMGAFAHELKTPMTSIIGYADLLRQEALEGHDRIAAAGYIFSEGQRLEKLSFQLLDLLLLNKDALNMRQTDLKTFTVEIDKALRGVLSRRGVRFLHRSGEGDAFFEPDLIKSVLYNLIDNAAKSIDGSGLVVLVAKKVQGGCVFQVVDNGRGMNEQELKRITEPFYRVDKSRSRAQGGAGLGLSLCKRIVELHNGSLEFSSEPGRGTCATVTLMERGVHVNETD